MNVDLVLCAIRGALHVGSQARADYVNSTKRRALVLPLPDFNRDPSFSAAVDFFTDREPRCANWRKAIDVDNAVKQALDAAPPVLNLAPLISSFPYSGTNTKFFERSTLALYRRKNALTPAGLQDDTSGKTPNESSRKPLGLPSRHEFDQPAMEKPTAELEFVHSKIAVFGAVTENYAEYMVATLRSFKECNGEEVFDYFILGHAFSLRTQRLISRYGIRYLDINLKSDFISTHKHRYPRECFWIFKGPELFNQRGYRFSVSVDADVLCNRKLPLDWLSELKHLAGVVAYCKARDQQRCAILQQRRTQSHGFLCTRGSGLPVFRACRNHPWG